MPADKSNKAAEFIVQISAVNLKGPEWKGAFSGPTAGQKNKSGVCVKSGKIFASEKRGFWTERIVSSQGRSVGQETSKNVRLGRHWIARPLIIRCTYMYPSISKSLATKHIPGTVINCFRSAGLAACPATGLCWDYWDRLLSSGISDSLCCNFLRPGHHL